MTNPDQMGAAYHEAGHAVVAWAIGWKVGRLAIAIGGDDAKGAAQIEENPESPLIDRIAVCYAGLESQELFDAPTHDLAGFGDHGKVYELLSDVDEDAGLALRNAGSEKARELLTTHREKLVWLATALLDQGELDQDAVEAILDH